MVVPDAAIGDVRWLSVGGRGFARGGTAWLLSLSSLSSNHESRSQGVAVEFVRSLKIQCAQATHRAEQEGVGQAATESTW